MVVEDGDLAWSKEKNKHHLKQIPACTTLRQNSLAGERCSGDMDT